MADRHEQRPLVDPRVGDPGVVIADDDFEVALCLVRGTAPTGSSPPRRRSGSAGGRTGRKQEEDDGLGDRDVLVHDGRSRLGTDDPSDLVTDLERHRPPGPRPTSECPACPRRVRNQPAGRSATAPGSSASEWLIKYVVSARIGKRSAVRGARAPRREPYSAPRPGSRARCSAAVRAIRVRWASNSCIRWGSARFWTLRSSSLPP